MITGNGNINNIRNNIGRINSTNNAITQTDTNKEQVQKNGSFGSILQGRLEQTSGLKFSKHAELRLQSRNINLSQLQKDKMSDAVSKADAKGVKDSLVLMDNLAFVVNVRSRTVITAANRNELKDNVFTNIDGAVIV